MINDNYKTLKFYNFMEKKYKNAFDGLAEFYGNNLNMLQNNSSQYLYTLHNFDNHCINIYCLIDYFFSDSLNFLTQDGNSKNIFKLYLAVLFHDVGMTNFNMVRENHSKSSEEEVRRLWDNTDSVLCGKLRWNNLLDEKDINDICLIILSHSDIKDNSIANEENGLRNPEFENCRSDKIKIMAGILRLTDEMDCTESRIGIEIQKNQLDSHDKKQSLSIEHWEKLKCILNICISKENNRIIVLELNNNYINGVEDDKKKKIFHKYIPEIVGKLQKELDYVNSEVFNKSFCNGMSFKAEQVLINTKLYASEINIKFLYEKKNTEKKQQFFSNVRIPSESVYVNSSSSVEAILRVDPFSNKDAFWGKGDRGGMFYDYSQNSNQIVKGLKNLNENYENINANNLNDWITRNWILSRETFVHMLVGYAGCGKSTFVKHIIKNQKNGRYSSFWNFYNIQNYTDVPQDKSLIMYIEDNLRENIIEHLNKSSNAYLLLSRFEENLRYFSILSPAFSCNTELLIAHIKESYKSNNLKNIYIKDEFFNLHSYGSKQIPLLALTFLWMASISSNPNLNIICVFDGLDIIDDPLLTVKLIQNVYTTLFKYRELRNKIQIKVVFTCRKFTLSLIESAKGDVTFSEIYPNYRNCITFLDISDLYQINQVIKHKAETIYSNPDILNLSKNDASDLIRLEECKRIADLSNDIINILDNSKKTSKTLSLSKIVNHNLRSASLLYHILFNKNENLYKSPSTPSEQICYKGFFIYKICYELNIKGIWKNMGYVGCDNSKTGFELYGDEFETFPTTLSRMIITLLYRSKSENALSYNRINEPSLLELYNSFKWMPYHSIKKGSDISEMDKENSYLSIEDFSDCMADMLIRSSSDNDEIFQEGIWRRPFYFGSHAVTNVAIFNKKAILKNEFINLLKSKSENMPTFRISECGEEFIDTFAIHYEFNAVRICNIDRPLWMVNDISIVESVVQRVYNSVKRCMEKQVWLATRYFNETKKEYFKANFHPLTNFGYDKKRRPQLHIIRVIFSHIAYLDAIRTLHWNNGNCDENKIKIIKTLNHCIANYLKLLGDNLNDLKINSQEKDAEIFKNMDEICSYVIKNSSEDDPYIKAIETDFPE